METLEVTKPIEVMKPVEKTTPSKPMKKQIPVKAKIKVVSTKPVKVKKVRIKKVAVVYYISEELANRVIAYSNKVKDEKSHIASAALEAFLKTK